MRTQQELVEKTILIGRDPIFAQFLLGDIIDYLDLDSLNKALEHLGSSAKISREEYDKDGGKTPLTKEVVLKEMGDYLPFAYEKAHGERGLSAARSIMHYKNWIWLLAPEDPDAQKLLNSRDFWNYDDYGIHILDTISEVFKLKKEE